jgi:hypothetical protein
MKTNLLLRFGIVAGVLFYIQHAQSQVTTPFEVRFETYLQGNATMISNQIINRTSGRTGPNFAYNDRTKNSKLNDEFDMGYIDIDDDPKTFSSSEATLSLTEVNTKKIVYAGLYWAATYPYNAGKRDRFWEFQVTDSKRESTEDIFIKLPGDSHYREVKGELLFDGKKQPMLKNTAPYVAYADITTWVKELQNPNGSYTVANVRATQGKIPGGSAGGWLIYFVYEDPNDTAKFIVSYDGFAGITARPHEIDFSGFKVLPKGQVRAQLGVAALEGDATLDGDQLEIKTDRSQEYVSLTHPLKPELNFFNSSLILHDNHFTQRKPASLNTLGFDTSLFEIENNNNGLIDNQTQKVTLKLKTNGDNYHFFWTAFMVESEPIDKMEENELLTILNSKMNQQEIVQVNKTVQSEVTNSQIVLPNDTSSRKGSVSENLSKNENINSDENTVAKTKEKNQEVIELKRQQVLEERNKSVLERNEKFISRKEMTSASELLKTNFTSPRKVALPGENFIIPKQNKGYYVVANVFAKPRNATRFVEYLKSLEVDAQYFINPNNNYRYVYVSYTTLWEDALKVYYSNVSGKYEGELWIMIVNSTLHNDIDAYSFMIPKDLD